jgi:hypothetical protein
LAPKDLDLPALPNGIGPSQPYCGERNFWMQRREAKIGLRERKGHRRPKQRNDTGENPAETARFDSAWKSAVWWDWMVVYAVRYEPVSTCTSLLTGKLTGIFFDFDAFGSDSGTKDPCAAATSRQIPYQN